MRVAELAALDDDVMASRSLSSEFPMIALRLPVLAYLLIGQ